MLDGRTHHATAVPTEEDKGSAKIQRLEPSLALHASRRVFRDLRMLDLWEMRGELSMVSEQIMIERAEAARAKGK